MQKTYNILVTGIGAIIGYGIINSLRKCKYPCHIIGMDIYPDAVGQAWCDTFIHAKPAAASDYVSFVLEVMEKYKIDLVLFGTEQEINRLAHAQSEIGDQYKKLVLNRTSIIDLSDDKWATICFLKEHGFPAIPSMIEGGYAEIRNTLGEPFLLKLRNSYAGKGMAVIHNEEEFLYHRGRIDEEQFMVQQLIGDNEHEYTAAAFGFGDGTCLAHPIVFARKLSQEGSTVKATRIIIPEIEDQICKLVQILKPVGPTNFQFRKHEGSCFLLEVNPRISSSTSIRTAFGYNESEMCIDWFVKHIKPEQPQLKEGTARRYIADWVSIL